MMNVPKEAYDDFRSMRGQRSIAEIFENFILKYLWTQDARTKIKAHIKDKVREKWDEDESRIMKESMENVEKRQELLAKQDDTAVTKELLYQFYNVKMIKEIMQFFVENGQGEDYLKTIAEEEEAEEPNNDEK